LKDITNEVAQQIVRDYLIKKKNTEKIDVSIVEKKHGAWIVRGTCPIDLEGHPWAEKFEVKIDLNGKILSIDFSLL
jgi:hypothetical protein